jgi:hypothetical protein
MEKPLDLEEALREIAPKLGASVVTYERGPTKFDVKLLFGTGQRGFFTVEASSELRTQPEVDDDLYDQLVKKIEETMRRTP